MATTPYMRLIEPTPLVTPGPAWATQVNTALSTIDAHDHTTDKGKQIPTAGININADLPFTGYGPSNMAWARFTAQTLPSAGTKPASLLVDASGNLYFENTSSVQVQLTSGGAIVPGGTGDQNGFKGDYANNAQVWYDKANLRYLFYSDIYQTGLANTVAGNQTLVGATPILFFSPGGKDATTNGFKITNTTDAHGRANGFLLKTDTSGAGTYSNAIGVSAIDSNGMHSVGINNAGGDVPLYITNLVPGANNTMNGNDSVHIDAWHPGTDPVAGFGTRIQFRAGTVAGIGSANPMGTVEATWQTILSRTGRVALRPWSGGSPMGVPGFEADGGGFAGILAASRATSGDISVGGAMWPTSTGSYNLGDSTKRWGALYVGSLDASNTGTFAGALTAQVGLTVSAGGATITGTTAITGALTVSTTASVPILTTSDTTTFTGAAGAHSAANNTTARAAGPTSGSAVTSYYNVSSTRTHVLNSGVYVYTLTNHSGQNGSILASISDGQGFIRAAYTNANEITVTTTNSSSAATDFSHSFIIVGGS